MKLQALAAFVACGTLASASLVKTRAPATGGHKGGNLLQASRNGHPIEMFTSAYNDAANDVNNAVVDSVKGNPCFGSFFAADSNLPGDCRGRGNAHAVDFFVKDFEKMDELPNYEIPKKKCHPKCRWQCDDPHCNSLCEPRCKPPKCVTACKKVNLAKCKRVCQDPQCAVVCPPQCEHGTCPKCKTVCGEQNCALQCGRSRCESSCADPDCVWDCKPNTKCQKPTCKMVCDTTVCPLGQDQQMPNSHEVPYMGQEIAWKGLGKIPEGDLEAFAGQPIGGAKLFNGATGGLPPGALPLPPGGLQTIKGTTGVTAQADVDDEVDWRFGKQNKPKTLLAPSALTPR